MGIKRFIRSTRGATSIEYAIIASLLSVLIVGGATTMGTKLALRFTGIAGNFN